ncbi:MAG: trigger factor [Thermoleophilia bacterium]|nr:trigger factor [Thermoleophilia bacterium]
MKTTLTERDGNTVKLTVEVSIEELQEAFNAQLRKLSREARIPGFRPGKVPAAIVRQRLGDEAILLDAVEESMGSWLAKAVDELGLEPVDRPEIELGDEMPGLDKPLGFTATLTVMPEVTPGPYKGVEVPKDPVEVEDREVDEQMDRLRDTFSELRPVEGRPVQQGDFVTVDLSATLDGKKVDKLEAVDYLFQIGANRMIPEVEEKLIGMNAGEEKTFPVLLPEEFPEDLRGKTVDFTVKLKDIKEKVLPPLTDQWVSEISEYGTLLELRQAIRSRIQAAKEQAAEQRFRMRAIKAVVDATEVDIPEVVIKNQAEQMMADFERSLESQGATVEAYSEATGVSREQILKDMEAQAAESVKTDLVLEAVAKAEGLEATDEEVSAMVGQMAAAAKIDAKAFEQRLRRSGRIESVREQLLRDKAADFIVANAVPVTAQAGEATDAETVTQEAPASDVLAEQAADTEQSGGQEE